ncbi:hypothetical protein K440DRAFT_628689 [Wilcoxina mikolae CBS 423.85]|nr:hypothetical protein K440DRAFT_628689 [Wilcoxina mikolae CBS 423.85]
MLLAGFSHRQARWLVLVTSWFSHHELNVTCYLALTFAMKTRSVTWKYRLRILHVFPRQISTCGAAIGDPPSLLQGLKTGARKTTIRWRLLKLCSRVQTRSCPLAIAY